VHAHRPLFVLLTRLLIPAVWWGRWLMQLPFAPVLPLPARDAYASGMLAHFGDLHSIAHFVLKWPAPIYRPSLEQVGDSGDGQLRVSLIPNMPIKYCPNPVRVRFVDLNHMPDVRTQSPQKQCLLCFWRSPRLFGGCRRFLATLQNQ
jgi:hypothetical protein